MKTLRAHGFNHFEQVVGYLERNEPGPKGHLVRYKHFYLDDFVQSSEDPNSRPLQHTPPLHSEDGFRTAAEATDKDVRLARRCQGYGRTRFVEDDRRETRGRPATALHHGPPAQHCRRRAGGSRPSRRRGGAGFPLSAALAGEVAGWRGWRGGNGGTGCGHCRRRGLRPGLRHGLGAGEHALPVSRAARTRLCRTSGPPTA